MPFDISRRGLVTGAGATLLPRGLTAREMRTMVQPREMMWRRIMDDLSFEQATVRTGDAGPVLAGTVLVAEKGAPLRLDYRVTCDEAWRTRTVELSQTYLGRRRNLRLEHDGEGRWRLDGRDAPALAGCTDVDLGLSPSTNALPINRLGLAQGMSATIRAAWLRFPSLDVVPAEQRYTRLSERHYRYRSLASGFEAVIEVDADGLPLDYAGIWRRVAEGPIARAPGPDGFVDALLASGPSPELGEAADDFGWLIGGWSARVRDFAVDGTAADASGEWWFAWVLEGRAMQDVWISPARRDRVPGLGATRNRYGTTIRRFDRAARLWRISWINPASGAANHLAGRREGDRIALLGEADDAPIRWSFIDIAADHFRWRGERQQADGGWQVESEFQLTRRA